MEELPAYEDVMERKFLRKFYACKMYASKEFYENTVCAEINNSFEFHLMKIKNSEQDEKIALQVLIDLKKTSEIYFDDKFELSLTKTDADYYIIAKRIFLFEKIKKKVENIIQRK